MVYKGTLIKVIDNSGAQFAQCLKILHKSIRSKASLGDKMTVVIKKAMSGKKVHKHEIHQAILVRSPNWVRRPDGSSIKFINPGVILLKKDGTPIAKRILGPVGKELRNKGYLKIISISSIAI